MSDNLYYGIRKKWNNILIKTFKLQKTTFSYWINPVLNAFTLLFSFANALIETDVTSFSSNVCEKNLNDYDFYQSQIARLSL